jgi:plastocyanin domain-containing protein
MRRLAIPAFLLLALAASCKKEEKAAPAPAAPAPAAAAADGTARRVDIKVDKEGYHPDAIPARPGEKLILSFTRTEDVECIDRVVVGGATVALPVGKPVDVPVEAPASGELAFACGMDMVHGRVTTSAPAPATSP